MGTGSPFIPDEIAIQGLFLRRNPFIPGGMEEDFFPSFLPKRLLRPCLLSLRFPACLGFGFLTGSLGSLARLLHLVGYHLVYLLVQSGKLLLLLFYLFFSQLAPCRKSGYVLLFSSCCFFATKPFGCSFGNQTVFLGFHTQYLVLLRQQIVPACTACLLANVR